MGIRPRAICSISLPICSTRRGCASRSDPRARRYARSAGHLHVDQNELPLRATEFFSPGMRSSGVIEWPRRSQTGALAYAATVDHAFAFIERRPALSNLSSILPYLNKQGTRHERPRLGRVPLSSWRYSDSLPTLVCTSSAGAERAVLDRSRAVPVSTEPASALTRVWMCTAALPPASRRPI